MRENTSKHEISANDVDGERVHLLNRSIRADGDAFLQKKLK